MIKPVGPDEIVIGFSTAPGNPIAWSIRHFEKTPYSHVYSRFYNPLTDRVIFFHSNIDGVSVANEKHFFEHNVIIEEFAFKVSPEVMQKVIQKGTDRLHLQYGRVQLLGMALVRIWHSWFNFWPSNPMSDKEKTQVCSELVGHLLIEMGMDLDPKWLEIKGPRWIHENVLRWESEGLCRRL